jgi:hypothetical protein
MNGINDHPSTVQIFICGDFLYSRLTRKKRLRYSNNSFSVRVYYLTLRY